MSTPQDLIDERWHEDAACADADPELFFAGDDRSVAEAMQLCAACDVRRECLEAALAVGEMHGVWGGTTETERRRTIRARRRERRRRRQEAADAA